MIEELLSTNLPSVTGLVSEVIGHGNVAPEAVSLSTLVSGFGAVILGKFTGSVGMFTMPFNYAALFAGAIVANWAFDGIKLPVDQTIQQPMLVTVGGMLLGACAILCWLKEKSLRR